MPYRADPRTADSLRARIEELEGLLEGAELRCRAAAGQLRELADRLDTKQRSLDEEVADALDLERRAMRKSMAAGAEPSSGRVGDALRAQGAVAALERAMARKGRRPSQPSKPPPPLGAARARLRDARRARAKLAAGTGDAVQRAQVRLADAVAAHDALADELEGARRRLEELEAIDS